MDTTKLRKTKRDSDGRHYFEHTAHEKILPWRQWVRDNMPSGPEGFVHEDVDGLVSLHGPLSPSGPRFLLIEYKWWDVALDLSQVKNLQLLHQMLRRADPQRFVYVGIYVLEWSRNPTHTHVRLNQHYLLDGDALYRFYAMQDLYPSYFEMEKR